MQPTKAIQNYFFLLFLTVATVLVFFVLLPFFNSLVVAAVLAILFRPLYRKLKKYVKFDGLAALLTLIIVLLILVGPVWFFGQRVFSEARDVYTVVTTDRESELFTSVRSAISRILGDEAGVNFSVDAEQYIKQGLSWLINHAGVIFTSIAQTFVNILIGLIAFYYLLKDGPKLKAYLIDLSPLSDKYDEQIIARMHSAVTSVIRGAMLIAIVQGLLSGIGFAIFGVPHAALWGAVAMFSALIPGIGTALVIAPAIIFLFVKSTTLSAVGLLIWGLLAVGLIDNFLGPILIGNRLRVHSLLILLSVLGGIALFGPIGFLAGPLVIALLFALLDIYRTLYTDEEVAK